MEKDASFYNRSGRRLHGVLSVPDGKNFPVTIICHGYASSTESKTRAVLSRMLLAKGIASFGFDFTGCGSSEGELYELTVSQGLEDLAAAFGYVKSVASADKERIALLGSSFSGSVAVLFAAENPVKVLALKSPVSDYSQLKEVPLIAKSKQKTFFDDSARHDIYSAAGKIRPPTIIVHGSSDADVPAEQSTELFSRLKCEKKLELIKNADHRYSSEKDFSLMAEKVSGWISGKI